ncbi:MAG TPA: response regulator transcription factor [Thermoanaerobaculia bacterium]
MIRVAIVDDEMLIRQGLRNLLELAGGFEVCGEAADGEEAIASIPHLAPDVVLLDVRMPRAGGLDVLTRLGTSLPPTLILTTFDDAEVMLAAIRAGARGYLQKDVSLEQLAEAIRTLAAGKTFFQPLITASVRRGFETARIDFSAAEIFESLTDRETEVLRLMAGGYSNREIAEALDTAEGTVKNQVSSILAKLGVRDRTRAVLKAIEAGRI